MSNAQSLTTKFIEAASRRLSPDTVRTYRYQLQRLEEWLGQNNLDFGSLTPEVFKKYLDEHSWKQNTQHTISCAARSLVRWAYGSQHPLLQERNIKSAVSPQRTLDQQQIRQILDYLRRQQKPHSIRNLSMITLMLDSGARVSEICRLQIEHIKPDKRIAYVLGKGGQWGYIAWGKTAAKYLEEWLRVRGEIVANSDDPATLYVSLNTSRPAPMTPAGVRSIFRRIGKKAGVNFSPHDLRRTFATLSLAMGANTRQVQLLGRWKDIRMVERYSQALMIEHLRDTFPFPSGNLDDT